jgi:hypothetical protein
MNGITMKRQRNPSDKKNLRWFHVDRPVLENLDHIGEEEGLILLNILCNVDKQTAPCGEDAFFQIFDPIPTKQPSKPRKPRG